MRFRALFILLILTLFSCTQGYYLHTSSRRVHTGLERFIKRYAHRYEGKKAVIVTNHSGVDFYLKNNIRLFKEKGIKISAVLAPEHGLYGYQNEYSKYLYKYDYRLNSVVYNMHRLDRFSMRLLLESADIVIFDIQDMGMRCYTYISNLKWIMDSLRGTGSKLIVLDRPNPLGFLKTDGAFLEKRYATKYVSAFPAPFLYNMTIGEAARYYRGEYAKDVDLRVIRMGNYSRNMYYFKTMLPWVPPSPNLPTYESSIVYSAVVLLEGVNLSLGRGTPKPFEYIGAPWINPDDFAEGLRELNLENFRFRPIYFSPTFSKYAGQVCGGVQIFYTGGRFSPTEISYRILSFLRKNYPQLKWQRYKNSYNVDALAGTDRFRKYVSAGKSYEEFEDSNWKKIKQYKRTRKRYLIY